MQDQRQENQNRNCRLALQFHIDSDETSALCNRFRTAITEGRDKGYSCGMIAVMLTRIIKEAIDLKFEKKPISAEHLVLAHDSHEPEFNKLKASLVRGMFLTCIEHPQGFPGLFDILAGIASAGMGYGSFQLPETGHRIKLDEIHNLSPDQSWIRETTIELMLRLLVPEKIAGFASARIGLFSMLVGSALLPFYAVAASHATGNTPPDREKVIAMVCNRFSPDSERLKKFLSQNLFVVFFEELFTHESTVFSIFNL